MDYRTAKQRVDEVLDREDAEAAWFREARANRRNPLRVVQHEIGQLYRKWLDFGPAYLTRAEMARLKKEGPRFGFRGHAVAKHVEDDL